MGAGGHIERKFRITGHRDRETDKARFKPKNHVLEDGSPRHHLRGIPAFKLNAAVNVAIDCRGLFNTEPLKTSPLCHGPNCRNG